MAKNKSWELILFIIFTVLITAITIAGFCCLMEMRAKSPVVLSIGEPVTKLTDTKNIKKRMEFHGCLVCQKDSMGIWWFDRGGKQCKLWSSEQYSKEEN